MSAQRICSLYYAMTVNKEEQPHFIGFTTTSAHIVVRTTRGLSDLKTWKVCMYTLLDVDIFPLRFMQLVKTIAIFRR